MTDDQLRSLVRAAVTRHLASQVAPPGVGPGTDPGSRTHPAAFHRYALPRGDDGDGPCLIEPAVHCNHCGFCQSHGY